MAIAGGGLGLGWIQHNNGSAIKQDLGVKINAAMAKLRGDLESKIQSINTRVKKRSSHTLSAGLGGSHTMVPGHPAMRGWVTRVMRCVASGGRDCCRLTRA